MADIRQARKALTRRILEETAKTPPAHAKPRSTTRSPRSAALVDKVARHAQRVTDE